MAKKRRLSKRDRKINAQMSVKTRWNSILEDEEFTNKIFLSIESIDPTHKGVLMVVGKILRYCFLDDKEDLEEYEIAILTDEGVFIYSQPYSASEAPF